MNSLVRQATVSVLSIELLCALTFAGASVWHESAPICAFASHPVN